MSRSSKLGQAERIHAAMKLLEQGCRPSEAARALSGRFQISYRQSCRYVRVAQEAGGKVSFPQPKIAFTVKLSRSLVQRVRAYAKLRRISLSELVTQAVEAFLGKRGERGGKNQSE